MKNFLKIPYRQSFFVRCRITYVLNNLLSDNKIPNKKNVSSKMCALFMYNLFTNKNELKLISF